MNAVAVPVSLTSAESPRHCRKLYLDLIQRCLLGRDWPLQAHSMIGNVRMANLRAVVGHMITHDMPVNAVIVNDNGAVDGCRHAIADTDDIGAWWVKTK